MEQGPGKVSPDVLRENPQGRGRSETGALIFLCHPELVEGSPTIFLAPKLYLGAYDCTPRNSISHYPCPRVTGLRPGTGNGLRRQGRSQMEFGSEEKRTP